MLLSGLQIRPASGNAAPTAADGSFTIAKNSYRNFKLADFGFADADVGDELQSIKIISLPALGQLALSGNPLLLNQVIALADIKNGNLRYSPAAGGTGAPYTNFQFKVSDGVALSTSTYTMTATVVAQASQIDIQFYRVASGDTAFGPGAAVIGSAGNQWNNLDMGTNNGQYAPHFTSIKDVNGAATGVTVDFANYPAVDDWGSGDYWTWGQYDMVPQYHVTSSDTFFDLVRSYVADPDVTLNGLTPGNYDIFALLSQRDNRQQGVTLHGASNQSKPYGQYVSTVPGAPLVLNRDYVLFKNFTVAADGKLRINHEQYDRLLLSGLQIRPATGNTAPVGTNGTFAMALNTFRILKLADFGFSDADVGDELQTVKMTTLPASGKLYLNGVEVLLNQIIALADIKNGNLKFVPASYAVGAGYDSLGFQVSDGVAFGTAKTATFDVLNRANLINVQFLKAANGDVAFGPGAAVVGAAPDQWNNLDMGTNNGQYAPHFLSIKDVNGNPTGVTVDFANYPAIDDWGNTDYWTFNSYHHTAGTFYDLLRSYIADPDVTINGLTPGLYDFIGLFRQQDNRQQGITLHYGSTTQSKSYGNSSGAGTGAPLIANRDYVVFSGIAVGSDGKLRINHEQYDRLLLSGFQLARVSTPAGGASGTVTTLAGSAHAFTLADLAFAGIDYGTASAQIKITGLPTTPNSLKLNSTVVTLNQVISVADLAAGKLNYTKASIGTDSFLLQVSNDGGTSYSANDTTNLSVVAAQPTLVNVKFYNGNNGDSTYAGAGATGGVSDQWNNFNFPNQSTATPYGLNDSIGNPTAATLTYNNGYDGGDNWGNGEYWTSNGNNGRFYVSAANTPFYDLMRSYMHNTNMTVGGLTPGTYDFYVYLSSQREQLNQTVRIWVNGNNHPGDSNPAYSVMQQLYSPNDVTASASAPLVVHRDYVKFKNLTVDANGQLNFWWDSGESALCGFQIASASGNSLPTGANKSLTMAVNAYRTFASPDFGFADADAGDELQAVKVTALPLAGSLTLNGYPVLQDQVVAASALSGLRFDTSGTGVPYATFQFKVSDGTDFSAAANTMTVNVYPALVGASKLNVKFYHAANGDPTYSGAAAVGSVGDAWNNIDATSDGIYAHRLNTLLANSAGNPTGTGLMFNQANWDWDNWGSTEYWTANGNNGRFYVSAASTPFYDLMRSYIHNTNMTVYGLTPGTYDFYVYLSSMREQLNQSVRIWVNGNGHPGDSNPAYSVMQQLYSPNDVLASSSAPLVVHRDYVKFKNLTVDANGQLNFWWDSGEQTLCGFQLTAASGNALPAGTPSTIAMAVNTTHTVATTEFGFVDADAGDELQAVMITTVPAHGNLYLTGWTGPVLQNQIIAASAITTGALTYVPATDGTGTPYDSFQYKVSDGKDYSVSASAMAFNVYPKASLVNVKFYHAVNGDVSYSGAAAAGAPGDQWNNIDATSDGNWSHRVNTLLTSATSAATGVRLVFNQANWDWDNWGSGDYTTSSGTPVTSAVPTYDLMRSYIHNTQMSLTGITPGVYDFIVYSVSNRNNINQNTRFWVNANGHPYDSNPAYSMMQATTANLPGTPLVENRDYVVFTAVTVNSSGNLSLWWDSGEELLAGFQLKPSFNASFTTDKVGGEAPLAVQFTDTSLDGSGGTITGWSWDFGDGTTSTTPSPLHTYATWGNFQVRLTVTNSNSLSTVSKPTTIAVTEPLIVNVTSANLLMHTIVDVGAGHTVNFSSGIGTFTFGGLTGQGTFALKDASNACITLQVGGTGPDTTWAGILTGCGGLSKIGTNTFTLANANTYLGDTTVYHGTLKLAGGGPPVTPTSWFDASKLTYTDGQSVDTWPDASSNGHTATKINGSMTLRANVINGLPAVEFAGNGIASIAGNQYSKVQYIVTKMNGGDWGAWMGSNSRGGYMWNQNGNCWDGNVPAAAAKNGAALSNPFGLGANRNSQYMVLKIVGNDNNTSPRAYELGRTEGWCSLNNYMAEILSYDHVLTSEEDAAVGGYLAGKYNISTSYPPYVAPTLRLPTTTTVRFDASGDGVMNIANASNTVDKLYIDGAGQVSGTWGATGSGATHINNTRFSGPGVLNVTTTATGGGTNYTLAYDGNTNTGGTAPSGGSYASGALMTVAAPGTLVKTGYTFAHWNTAANDSGTSYNPAATFNIAANTTLYAQWTIDTFTLTYTAGSGGSISGTTPQTVNYGASGALVTAVPDASHNFTSWSDGVLTASRTDINVVANLSVSASFTLKTYTLTYTAGLHGSIVGTSPQTVNYGGSGTQVTAVADTGYHFTTWTDSSGSAARTDTNVTGNISQTAGFAITQYALTYDGNGSTSGSLPTVSANHDYNTTITVLGNTGSLKLANHSFAGWNTAADGSGTGRVTGNTFAMPASSVTLYAMWAPNYALVETKDNGGAATKELTLTVAVPANAVLSSSGGAQSVSFNGVTYTIEASTDLTTWTAPVSKFAMSYTHAGLPTLPDGGFWKYQTYSAFEGTPGKGFIRRSIIQP
ncbi:MAG: InlB B-repeat-containing protein [Verrucomicrobiota bacterium]